MRIEVNVPTDWSDIKVRQYQDYYKNVNSDKSDKKKLLRSISILCGVPEKQLVYLSVNDVERLSVELNSIAKHKPTEGQIEQVIDFNGTKYGLIPNLSEMTTGEFIDLETYCKDTLNNLHYLLSILYRPIVGIQDSFGRYEIEDYEPTDEKANTMLDFPMDKTLLLIDFFFHLGEQLMTSSSQSSVEKRKQKTTKTL